MQLKRRADGRLERRTGVAPVSLFLNSGHRLVRFGVGHSVFTRGAKLVQSDMAALDGLRAIRKQCHWPTKGKFRDWSLGLFHDASRN